MLIIRNQYYKFDLNKILFDDIDKTYFIIIEKNEDNFEDSYKSNNYKYFKDYLSSEFNHNFHLYFSSPKIK